MLDYRIPMLKRKITNVFQCLVYIMTFMWVETQIGLEGRTVSRETYVIAQAVLVSPLLEYVSIRCSSLPQSPARIHY